MREIGKQVKSNLRRGESGQAVIESLFTMIVLCILLFGLLQVFQIAVANLLTSYSAFTANRSYIVGFSNESGPWYRELVHKSARVAAIGASGKRIFPQDGGYEAENIIIKRYLEDTGQWLEYEYWWGDNEYDDLYYRSDVDPPSTHIGYNNALVNGGLTKMNVWFSDYPFAIMDLMDPDRVWFDTVDDSRTIRHSASLYDHAVDFMIDE